MTAQPSSHVSSLPTETEDEAIRALCRNLWAAWNARNADAFATQFAEDGAIIGFDGSQMAGRAEIAAILRQIFADHVTPAYVGKIRSVRLLAQDVALLHAVAGMVPPGQVDLNPQLHAVQVCLATRSGSEWRIAHFQNTPAQLHGRPDLVEQLTAELRELL